MTLVNPPCSQASPPQTSPTAQDVKVQEAIAKVQNAARWDTTRTGQPHADLLEAIRQLNLAVEEPQETLMRIRFEPLQVAATRLMLEIGVLDAIAAKHGDGATAKELGEKTGYDALLIERAMRQVTWSGICHEAGHGTYAATATTQLIVSPGGAGGVKHIYDLFTPIAAKLMAYTHETKVHQFPGPSQKTAFQYAHGDTLWGHMGHHPSDRKAFDDYMTARRAGIQSWFEIYPIATELCPSTPTDSVLLVDIGGNQGHEAASFHAAHPDHPGRVILQDLDSMIQKVRSQGVPDGLEAMAYDFFTEQPIKGARAYYLRSVLHDWDDASAEAILKNTAKAMALESRLLIDEYVLPDTGAAIRGASLDFLMMMYCGGMERSEKQWRDLLDRCGLTIVKVWGGRSDYEQVIEAKLKSG